MNGAAAGTTAALFAVIYPLVLALGMVVRPLGDRLARIMWTAALPAFVVAAGVEAPTSLELDWLLLGARVGMADATGRALLLATAILWSAASAFARTYVESSEHRGSFSFYFLLTAAANIGMLLAADVVTFYVMFAVMTVAAYGVILHERTDEARRAGRIYLGMAIVAEAALLAALWLIVGDRVDMPLADAPAALANAAHRDAAIALLFVGFGVKAGVVPLHVWLPLAHPVAPAPASAVLSGALIKGGLLGWLRFLPLGVVALPSHGAVWTAVGVVSIVYGALVGALQKEPKTVLAYSSISQMGFMVVPLGVALAVPASAGQATLAIVLFAQQHAIAKGALFLGTAVAPESGGRSRRAVMFGLVLSALAIAGGPLTSGALAKGAVKDVTEVTSHVSFLGWALAIGSIGSTLLMIRFLSEIAAHERGDLERLTPRRALLAPWALLVGVGVAYPVHAAIRLEVESRELLTAHALWSAAWPVLAGAVIAGAARVAVRRGRSLPAPPPGDVLEPLARVAYDVRERATLSRVRAVWKRLSRRSMVAVSKGLRAGRWLELADVRMRELRTIGAIVLVLVVAASTTSWCGATHEHGTRGARPSELRRTDAKTVETAARAPRHG